MLVHASLFSGIGGFDLAAEWMGWDNLFHCEWNPFGQRVLKHHFPKSISYNDITQTDFSIHKGSVDILTGGFPCQPYSTAGKRLGKADERHLFPHMLRCIKEVKPKWVVGENVRGLVNWNGGLVFNEVYDDLEREGYEVQSFLIPAAGVNAPHQRYRIWFVAYSNDKGRCSQFENIPKENGEVSKWNNNTEFSDTSIQYATNTFSFRRWEDDRFSNGKSNVFNEDGKTRDVTNSSSIRLEQYGKSRKISFEKREDVEREKNKSTFPFKTMGENVSNSKSKGLFWLHKTWEKDNKNWEKDNKNWENSKLWGGPSRHNQKSYWDNFPTKPPICGGDDGIPRTLDTITFSKWRNESIKAYGNAIVPQVAYEIFKAIQEFELMVNK